MISNLQKREFLESIFERIPQDAKNEDAIREIMEMLMADTDNGKMYKYRAFNDYALSNLKEGTLYCAVPSSFNDPFDCKIGIDIQSSIEARFGQEFEEIGEYFLKFLQVIDGKVSIDTCIGREKRVFRNWFNSQHLCEFINKYRGTDIADEELIEAFVSEFDILAELFIGFSTDTEFVKQMELAKETMPIIANMSKEQREQVINQKATFSDFARSFGVDEDVDEITLMTLLHQIHKPEQAEVAKKVDDDLARANRELGESIDRQYRVGSLCTDYKNCLMWSHYADGHKGFCIEYGFSKSCEALKELLILPVVYSKERIKFPWRVAFATNKEDERIKQEAAYTMLLSLLTKDEVWSYENEWRIIILNTNETPNIKMPPISCIYVGALCSVEHKEMIIKIAKELNVPVKQMTVDRGEYTLHAQDCIE